MTPDPAIITTLRKMFASGATPAKLIRYLADCFDSEPGWPGHVQTYFSAAFFVVLLDLENKHGELNLDERKASHFNTDVLHEMVGRAHLWRGTIGPIAGSSRVWFDGLAIAPDELSLIDSTQPETHPSLKESWSAMNRQARDFVRQAMVNSQSYFEKTEILARLVEQLQQQVSDLERQVERDASGCRT